MNVDYLLSPCIEVRPKKACSDNCEGCLYSANFSPKLQWSLTENQKQLLYLLKSIYTTKKWNNLLNIQFMDYLDIINIDEILPFILWTRTLWFAINPNNINNTLNFEKLWKIDDMLDEYIKEWKITRKPLLQLRMTNTKLDCKVYEFIDKISYLNMEHYLLQFGSNKIDRKNFNKWFKDFFIFIERYFPRSKYNWEYFFSRSDKWFQVSIILNYNNKDIELIYRNIYSDADFTIQDYKDLIYNNQMPIVYSLFPDKVQFQHTSLSVNEKWAKVDYKKILETLIYIKENLWKIKSNFLKSDIERLKNYIVQGKISKSFLEDNIEIFILNFILRKWIYDLV